MRLMTKQRNAFVRCRLIYDSLFEHVKYRSTGVPRSGKCKTHYDVLGLSSNCSTRQIKKAYVRLCKQLHPDMKPGDTAQHKKFIELNNAYSVLVRSESRLLYDHNLSLSSHSQCTNYDQTKYETYTASRNPFERESWRGDETIWSMRGKPMDKSYGNSSYYGIKGLPRQSNAWIVGGCTVLILFGVVLHYIAFWFGSLSHKKLDELSTKNSELYREIRKKAIDSSNEKQKERLKGLWELSNSYDSPKE